MKSSKPARVPSNRPNVTHFPVTRPAGTAYEIVVRGHLDEGWSPWFGGLAVHPDQAGNTHLVGTIPDQAALFGILLQFRDLGLSLISLQQLETNPQDRRP